MAERVYPKRFSLLLFAIRSPLGAGLNAFVDYGSSPFFTATLGAFLIQDRLSKWFAISACISVLGVMVLALPRLILVEFSSAWFGLVACAIKLLLLRNLSRTL